MAEITETVQIIAQQARQAGLAKRSNMLIQIDENTLRINKGKTNIDIAYDVASDMYNVTIHKMKRDLTTVSKTFYGVFWDQFGDVMSWK